MSWIDDNEPEIAEAMAQYPNGEKEMTPLEKFKAERDELAEQYRLVPTHIDLLTQTKFKDGFNAALRSSAVRELVRDVDDYVNHNYPSKQLIEALSNFNEILKGLE